MNILPRITLLFVILLGSNVLSFEHSTIKATQSRTTVDFVQIAIFYDGSKGDVVDRVLELAEGLDKLSASQTSSVTTYIHDTSASNNRKRAATNNLDKKSARDDGVHVFVHVSHDGIHEYTHSNLSPDAVLRYFKMSLLVGNPHDVISFTTSDDFYALVDDKDPPKPLFVLFSSAHSPACYRARQAFIAGATHLKDLATFIEVNCGKKDSSKSAKRFCTERNVSHVPTFALFTGEEWVPYTFAEATLGDFNVFLHQSQTKVASDAQINITPDGQTIPVDPAKQKEAPQSNSLQTLEALAAAVESLQRRVKILEDVCRRS